MTGRAAVPERVRPTLVVTRETLRQLLRKQRDSPLLLAVIAGFNLFLAAALVGVTGPGGYDLGVRLAAGDAAAVAERIRSAALSGLVLVSVMHALGAAADGRFKHRRVAFLTATSTAAVVTALVARRAAASLVLFGPALLAAAAAFALGAGVPTAGASLALGGLWLVVLTAVATLPLGLVANWAIAGYDLSSNARVGLGAVVLGAFYLALFGRGVVAAALAGTPVDWAGDLLLLSVPGAGADPARAAVFAVATVLFTVVVVAACVRLAAVAWYGDPAFGGEDDDAAAEPLAAATGVRAAVERVCAPRTAALVGLVWRRTRRTPKVLFYVYPAAFVGVVLAEQLVVSGPFSPALLPAVVGFAGGTAVGSGFTLNPLGTEGDALPALLTAGAGSDRIVRAKALAAGLPGGALVVALALAVAVIVGAPPFVVAAAAAYAAALAALAPLLSQALGVHYPPDHEGLLGGSVKVPDKSASALYTAWMVTVAVPGFAGFGVYATSGDLDPLIVGSGVLASVALAAGLAAVAYRHAVDQLATYSVE